MAVLPSSDRHSTGNPDRARRLAAAFASLCCCLLATVADRLASAAVDRCTAPAGICETPAVGAFTLIRAGRPAALVVDGQDYPGVLRAARSLRTDLSKVAGASAPLSVLQPQRSAAAESDAHAATDGAAAQGPEGGLRAAALHRPIIIIGTLGHSPLIDRLVRRGRLDISGVRGRWEAFVRQVVEQPMPGIDRALVLAGSDKRGTIFAIYDLSRRIGVSPWVWWADVPVRQHADLFVAPGRFTDRPTVRYRGIFLNDEEPALGGWAREKFGGLNHRFYAHVFELILRLKANFLWPAMWDKSIYEDDPASPALANEMGVVLGTSHHEPMMRAQADWHRHGAGPWDYTRNAARLRRFWREGIERTRGYESVVTIGMRGDGDKPMTQGTAIPLLERIVADQRRIISQATGRPASRTPQVWALYKEVQDYYDRGMRVPDDVTLLFSDDNWGNLRRLPPPGRQRAGGYGIYYHFDYVGGPRSYKWLDTNQIERVWEQMELAHAHGADRLWIVNVGDLKPMELPTQFFLDLAWSPGAMTLAKLRDYPREWAAEQFGAAHSAEIGAFLTRYTQYNARRKPELVASDTYSLVNFREAARVVADYDALAERARRVGRELPPRDRDAYFELVLFPIEACANLNELYVDDGLDRLYAEQGRAATSLMARRVESLFQRDAELTRQYHQLAGGKWDRMMSQSHFGYVGWHDPPRNVMPAVRRITVPERAGLGVAIEGSRGAWPRGGVGARHVAERGGGVEPSGGAEPSREGRPELPVLTPFSVPSRYIEVFDRGSTPFPFTISVGEPWLKVSRRSGLVKDRVRIEVSADWRSVPEGLHRVPIVVRGAGESVTIEASVIKRRIAVHGQPGERRYVEADGYVAVEAAHYSRAVDSNGIRWMEVPHLGRTLSAMTVLPRIAPAQRPGGDAPRLEYDVYLFEPGEVSVDVTLAPTLDFTGGGGLRYAVSIDDGAPRIVNVNAHEDRALWGKRVADNANVQRTRLRIAKPGAHTVKIWMVDPGLDFERIVVAAGPLPPSYLGPPESTTLAERHFASASRAGGSRQPPGGAGSARMSPDRFSVEPRRGSRGAVRS